MTPLFRGFLAVLGLLSIFAFSYFLASWNMPL
jgi:hypothetical protein